MLSSLLWPLVLSALLVSAATPTRPLRKRAPANFVSIEGGQFFRDGKPIKFLGTNAYWLPSLSERDIDITMGNITKAGFSYVRFWAFNDVHEVPQNGSWLQLITPEGETRINEGPNGLQRLDAVFKLAEKHGLLLRPVLSNNWNPGPNSTAGLLPGEPGAPAGVRVRNARSNDYGGMDAYVRIFGDALHHDQFYGNDKIIDKFLNYTSVIVDRYKDSPAILAWELANDPRCNSTLPSASSCATTLLTRWHATVSKKVKEVDPNHLVASGTQGYLCPDCPKLYPPPPPPVARPQPSPAPGGRRRFATKPLSRKRFVEDLKNSFRRSNQVLKRSAGGVKIRGRWVAPKARHNNQQELGPSYDGSFGVDSEDILGIPDLDVGSFQLLPNQYTYLPDDPNLPAFNNTVNAGISWIQQHAALARTLNKPITLDAFGLVTQENAPYYQPFDTSLGDPSSTTPTPIPGLVGAPLTPGGPPAQQFFATDEQRDDAYAQWLKVGLEAGLEGMTQYQWSQDGLTVEAGTFTDPTVTGTELDPTVVGTGLSPNDGYAIQGSGKQETVEVFKQAAQQFAVDDPSIIIPPESLEP